MDNVDLTAVDNIPASLPVDVANVILQYLLDEPILNKATLQKCTLACHHFRYQIRRSQFRSITLNVEAEVKDQRMEDTARQITGLQRLLASEVFSMDSGYALRTVVRSLFITIQVTLSQRYGTAPIYNTLHWQTRISDILSRVSCLQEFGLRMLVRNAPTLSIIPVPWNLFPMAFRSSVIAVLQLQSLRSLTIDSIESFPVPFIPVGSLSHLALHQVYGTDTAIPVPAKISPPLSGESGIFTSTFKQQNHLNSLHIADSVFLLKYLLDQFPQGVMSIKSLSLDLSHSQRQHIDNCRYTDLLPQFCSLQSLELTNRICRGHVSNHDLKFDVDLHTLPTLKKLTFDWVNVYFHRQDPRENPKSLIWDVMKVFKNITAPTAIEHLVFTTRLSMLSLTLAKENQSWTAIDLFLCGPLFPNLSKVTVIMICVLELASSFEDREAVQAAELSFVKAFNTDIRRAFSFTSRSVTVAFDVQVKTTHQTRLVPEPCILNVPQSDEEMDNC